MSENQYLENIENKLDTVTQLVEQQSKSGVFFDGFTKQILEKIHDKLEYISNFETNELISYLTEELKNTLADRHNVIQQRLDGVQGQISTVQANLTDSIKSPEVIGVFTKLSDTVLEFSRDLNTQTKFFNSAVENIQSEIGNINFDGKLETQTEKLKNEIANYKSGIDNLAEDINSSFNSVKNLINSTSSSEALLGISGDISVLQKGLNDIINAVVTLNNRQGELISSVANISTTVDVQDIRLDVSSLVAEMEALKDSVRVLVNKSDIEALNEKLNFAIDNLSNLKDAAKFSDVESKEFFQKYFNDLNGLFDSLASKKESELISGKLEDIQSALVSGRDDVRGLIEQNGNEIKNLIPIISSLTTKENIKELSENAVRTINELTERWNEKIAQSALNTEEKFNEFKMNLSNVYDVLGKISTKIDSINLPNELEIKEEIKSILKQTADLNERMTSVTQNSLNNLSGNFDQISNLINEKIITLESLINSSKDGLKENFAGNISELKEFSQKLVEFTQDISNKVETNSQDIKSLLEVRYSELSEKINGISESYNILTSSNKTEILNNINELKTLVETSKQKLENNDTYNLINTKIVDTEQKISELLHGVNVKVDENSRIVARLIDERYKELSTALTNITETYSTLSITNKSEILKNIEVLTTVVEASKQALENNDTYNLLNEKTKELSEILGMAKNELLTSNLQVAGAMSEQSNFLENIHNSIKDLYINIADGRAASMGNKSEIIETLAEKLTLITSMLNETKSQIATDLRGNKDNIALEFSSMRLLADEIKTILNEINENQASKQILAAILESVTTKLEAVSELVTQNKDFNLEQYDGIKNLTNNLKTDIDGVMVILNQSSSFLKSMMERISSVFNAITDKFEKSTLELKSEIKNLSIDQNVNLTEGFSNVDVQLQSINDLISSFNFDESVKEQLLDLRKQIESFNKQSLVDILTNVSDNNQKTSENVQETVNSIKANFEELLNRLSILQIQASGNKDDIKEAISQNFDDVSQKFVILTENIENGSYKNKQDILAEISSLKSSADDLRADIKVINDNLPKDELIIEQADRINSVISDFADSVEIRLDDIVNTDKGYVTEAVKDAFIEFQRGVGESINYLKGVSINLDRSLANTKNDILDGITFLKENSAKNIDTISELKDEIAEKFDNAAQTIGGHLTESITQRKSAKEEILAKLSEVVNSLSEKFTQSFTQRQAAKEEISAQVANLSQTINENSGELEHKINGQLQDNLSQLSEKLETFKNDLQTNSLNNKEQIINVVEFLKNKALDSNTQLMSLLETAKSEISISTANKVEVGISSLASKISALDSSFGTKAQTNKEELVEEINGLRENLSGLKADLTDSIQQRENALSSEFEQKISESTKACCDCAESAIEALKNVSVSNKDSILNEISSIRTVLQNSLDVLDSFNADIVTIQNDLISSFDDKIKKLEIKISDLLSNFESVSETMVSAIIPQIDNKLRENAESYVSKTNELSETLKSDISSISKNIGQTKDDIISAFKAANDEIEEKLNDNSSKINDFVNDVKQSMDTAFENISETLSNNKSDEDEFKESLKFEIKRSIDEITDKLFKADEDNSSLRSELLFELQKTYNILSEKFDVQSEKTCEIKSSIESSVKENFVELEEKIDKKYSKLQSNIIRDIADEINLSGLKEELTQDVVDNAISIKERIEEAFEIFSDNKDILELLVNKNRSDIAEQISILKKDLIEANNNDDATEIISQIKNLSNKVENVSEDILNVVSNELESNSAQNIKTLTEAVDDKISFIKDDIQEIVIKMSDIDSIVEKVKYVVMLQFEDYLDTYNSKLETFGNDLKNYMERNADKLAQTIQDYQKELDKISNIDLNSYNEETKQFVEEQIDSLKEKIDELSQHGSGIQDSGDIKETVIASSENISKRLELLRDMLLSEMPSGEEISSNFDDVISELDTIKQKTDNIETVVKNENAALEQVIKNENVALEQVVRSENASLGEIVKNENASLKDVLTRYHSELNALSNIDLSSYQDDTREFIRDELKHLKEQFVRNLAGVFDNISFIEESEEIQNAIFDNADDIKNEIVQLKRELAENSNDDIDAKFNNLKNILESITTGVSVDSGKYIYTLPDVETDIAKMRMAINEITEMLVRNKEDGFDVAERLNALDDMRDDVSSISKRTNKLILTSDDSNKHLKENIAEFKEILKKVDEQCNRIDSTQINHNIDDVKTLVMSGLKSDKILNEAFMHLAEWIDDSARTMNTIQSNVETSERSISLLRDELSNGLEKISKSKDSSDNNEITLMRSAVSDLAAKLERKPDMDYSKSLYEIEYGLDKLSDKLDVQELKIKSLEKKIDSLSSAQSGNDEITSLLEFIASQATAANENSRNNRILVQKIEAMERQMSQFEASISKITEFVDGAN